MPKKLSTLPTAILPLTGQESLYLIQDAASHKVTVAQLLDLVFNPAESNFRVRSGAGRGLQIANLDSDGALLGWRSMWFQDGALTFSDTDDNSD